MRLLSLALLAGLAVAQDAAHWSQLASKAKNGVIKLDSESYEALLSGPDREYSVVVELTAMPSQFKCQPCHDFHPAFELLSNSWRRQPAHERDLHFFASLDFPDGQAVFQKLGLTTAPTVQFHPALSGPNKGNKLGVVSHDLNRAGLSAPAFHNFLKAHLPAFDIHVPFNPLPLVFTALALIVGSIGVYTLWDSLLPLIQSRIIWGTGSIVLILTFTSGHMWNKIKNAPYVQMGEGGKVNWIAGGFQNQLGMETQVVAGIYGMLALSIVALTVLVPAQSSPTKQRVGVYLWLGILVVVFGILMRIFRLKNGGYPFWILF